MTQATEISQLLSRWVAASGRDVEEVATATGLGEEYLRGALKGSIELSMSEVARLGAHLGQSDVVVGEALLRLALPAWKRAA